MKLSQNVLIESILIFVGREVTCRPRTGLLTDKYQVLKFFEMIK